MGILIIGNTESSVRDYISNSNLPNDFISIKEFIEKEKLEEQSKAFPTISESAKLIRDVSIFSNRVRELYEDNIVPNFYHAGSKTEIRATMLIHVCEEVHLENEDGSFKVTRKKPEDIYHGHY